MPKQKPRRVGSSYVGVFSYVNKELYVKNKTDVKLYMNKEVVKMGGLIEKGSNLRKFLYFLITMVVLVLPIALGLGVWIARH